MRTKQDINEVQCERCGKIQKKVSDLYNCDIEGKYENLAICDRCYKELTTDKLEASADAEAKGDKK